MPSKNAIKIQAPDSYYHVFSRGANKQKIFLESADYKHLLGLFERYLSAKPTRSKTGEPYPHYAGKIELLAYCLMSNHFHLYIYQLEVPYMEKFMRSLMTSYSRYFNLKYKRTGPLFENRYKAVLTENNDYLIHITRYIHLNPRLWRTYRYSSLNFYTDGREPEWLSTKRILDLFESKDEYSNFTSDYEGQKSTIDQVKPYLANR